MLQFCPVCHKLLLIQEENSRTILYCTCGFKRYSISDFSIREIGKSKFFKEGVVLNKTNIEGNNHICKKCGHVNAEIIDLGERLNNESSIYIYKCMKCGYSER